MDVKEYGMRSTSIRFLFTLIIALGAASSSFAGVEWDVQQTLKMDQPPRDVVVSPDGKHIFLLTDSGGIFVYTEDGKIEGKIDVGYPVDQMKIGPGGKRLFLTSTKGKTLQVVSIDFIVKIDLSGSPYKGRQDAPVVIAVFSDFQ